LDVLGGQLLNPDGSSQTLVLSDFHRIRHEPRELVEVSGIVGAFMVVRRADWQKLNGMDEDFFQRRSGFLRTSHRGGRRAAIQPAFQRVASRQQQQKSRPPGDNRRLGKPPLFVAQENVGTGIPFQHPALRRPFFWGRLVFFARVVDSFFAPGVYRAPAQVFSPAAMVFVRVPRRLGIQTRLRKIILNIARREDSERVADLPGG
jgi:hypothetical protein